MKKEGGKENLTNDTPPKKGFWTLLRYVLHPHHSGVSALFFLYKNHDRAEPEALLEGQKMFWESAFFGTCSSPHTFCPPSPYHGPKSMKTDACKHDDPCTTFCSPSISKQSESSQSVRGLIQRDSSATMISVRHGVLPQHKSMATMTRTLSVIPLWFDKWSNSHIACEPFYKPNAGIKRILNYSLFRRGKFPPPLPKKSKPNSQWIVGPGVVYELVRRRYVTWPRISDDEAEAAAA